MEISSLSFTGVFNTEPLVLEAACNTITLKHKKPQVSCKVLTCCLFLSPFLATPLWAVYTWFSNSLYWPKVAVQTVHLYERWAGFRVLPWSLATWFNSFH